MKKIRFISYAFLSTSCLLIFPYSFGQSGNTVPDRFTLLTMPYNKRPVTLYKGQFQANAGYKLGIRTSSFDDSGSRLALKENGSASVFHCYSYEIKYGFNKIIEAGAEINSIKHGIRSGSVAYFSGQNVININNLHETTGFDDLLLKIMIKAPIPGQNFRAGIGTGISLPTARHEPEQPSHTISDVIDDNNYTINYHFNNKNGNGVPLFYLSASIRMTSGKVTLGADASYRKPLKEGTSIRWSQSLVNRTFIYYKTDYNYLPDQSLNINASIHYQASGWLDTYLAGNYFKSGMGWTDYYGVKYSNHRQSLFMIEPGFEIQISPSLRIKEFAGFPFAGKNADAPMFILTSISFNIFPW